MLSQSKKTLKKLRQILLVLCDYLVTSISMYRPSGNWSGWWPVRWRADVIRTFWGWFLSDICSDISVRTKVVDQSSLEQQSSFHKSAQSRASISCIHSGDSPSLKCIPCALHFNAVGNWGWTYPPSTYSARLCDLRNGIVWNCVFSNSQLKLLPLIAFPTWSKCWTVFMCTIIS